MYQLIGLPRLLSGFGILTAVIALIYSQFFPSIDWSDGWRIASISATFSGLLLLSIGQTPVFPMICRWPLINKVLPPIDGQWIGEFTSNFPAIAKAFKLPAKDFGQPITAQFIIKARLFNVSMSAVSISPRPNYMRSDTTAFRITRCAMTQREIIHYVYDAVVGDPEQSDVDRFYGAARLTIIDEAGTMFLEGAYWTDRNWQRGQNTAGTLKLRRPLTSA